PALILFFSLMIPRHPPSTLFPYTTLFRSHSSLVMIRGNRSLGKMRSVPSVRPYTVNVMPWCRNERSEICCRLRNSLAGSSRNARSEEHTSELQSRGHLVCRLLLEKKKKTY